MAKRPCHTCTTINRNVYHDGPCREKARQEKRMAEKRKTKAEKARARSEEIAERVGGAKTRLRRAEELLIDLEDRATRRAARREARRQSR